MIGAAPGRISCIWNAYGNHTLCRQATHDPLRNRHLRHLQDALKALRAKGHAVDFRDVRADPLSADEIAEIVRAFGDAAVNRQSTTWRSLSDWLKASDAEAQLAAQPTLMKRPVIRSGETLYLGWDAKVQAGAALEQPQIARRLAPVPAGLQLVADFWLSFNPLRPARSTAEM